MHVVGDIDLKELLSFHKHNNKIATVTAVQLEARFGGMELGPDNNVVAFREKAKDENKWINAGFFVLKPQVFDYLEGDMNEMMWEDEPLEKLAAENQLAAHRHYGFWKPMDALRDKIELEALWKNDQAKWKVW